MIRRRLSALRRRLSTPRRRAVAVGVGAVGSIVLTAFGLLAWSRAELAAPAPTLLVLDRHGRYLTEVADRGDADLEIDRGRGYWPLDVLPERVVAATLAIEDRRFWSHPGVDARAIVRAAMQNVQAGRRTSGASTVAMQTARLMRPGARTYLRKAGEAAVALALVARHGREEVLRHYLRMVPYGHGVHGIAYASRRFLDKPVADLSWAEVAFLSAIPQAPSRHDPWDPLGRARAVERGRRILDLLHAEGTLSVSDLRVAQAQIGRLRIPPRATRPMDAMHAVLRFDRALGDGERRRQLAARPIVVSTLDLDLQADVAHLAARRLEAFRARGAGNAAILVLDLAEVEVRAAVGSASWGDPRSAGAIDYLDVPRSPGSALKPFFYAEALDRGLIAPHVPLDDLGRGAGGIVNSDGRFLGPLLPRVALANSRNVPAAEVVDRLGVDEAWSLLGRLGLREGGGDPRRYGLGLAIGGLPVTVARLARAYTALAGDGRLVEPRWYARQPRPPARRVLSESSARRIARDLADPQARLPSFPRLGHTELAIPAAVKTGTSSRFRDSWSVMWTPRHLVVVWIGHPDHRPMQGLSGYRGAALLARDVVERLEVEADPLSPRAFPPPRNTVPVRVCPISGQRAGPACDRVTTVHLEASVAAQLGPCSVHRHLAIDARDGRLATVETPPEHVDVRAVAELPARYAAWAASAGIPRPPRAASDLSTSGVPTPGRGARAASAQPRELRIVSPRPDQRLLIDPELPPGRSTVALRAVVDPPSPQLLWKVDGKPYRLVDYPYETRWPLEPGDHRIEAEVPLTGVVSAPVALRVD
ncbi:MAG: transglycosylase domain-containing protein [Acidobacteriota bacterium]